MNWGEKTKYMQYMQIYAKYTQSLKGCECLIS